MALCTAATEREKQKHRRYLGGSLVAAVVETGSSGEQYLHGFRANRNRLGGSSLEERCCEFSGNNFALSFWWKQDSSKFASSDRRLTVGRPLVVDVCVRSPSCKVVA